MKFLKTITLALVICSSTIATAQKKEPPAARKYFSMATLTIEPGVGIQPAPMTDLVVSNLIQWNVKKRLSLVSLTSFTFNGPFTRNFNYITTHYNFAIAQKFGIGTSVYTRRSSHTFSLVAGIKYDAYKETLKNPEFEKVTVKRNTISPDFGLMYNGKVGQKKFFFSYRLYVPLYPYPVKSIDVSSITGNLSNISLEFGLGIRLK
ncbi:MAG TPA: hypothetical protein VK154_04585 [Chitinophagales bacterium]|nr:hypothetical protein [Chitinophagales bacterium]